MLSFSIVVIGVSISFLTNSWQLAKYRLNKSLSSSGVLNFSGLPKKTAPFASWSFWMLDHFLFIRLFSFVVLLCFFAISRKIKYKKTTAQTSLATQSISPISRYLSVRSLSAYCISVSLASKPYSSSSRSYDSWWIVYHILAVRSVLVCYLFAL